MRIVHGSQRFSEDLDFDDIGVSDEIFSAMIDDCIRQLAHYGLDADVSISQKDARHAYIKVKNILTDFWLAPETREEVQEKLMIRIDSHDQWYMFTPTVSPVLKFGIHMMIPTAPLPLLMAHKIVTIGQRKRAKWRDYFDLVFLMSKQVQPDMDYLEQMIWVATPDQVEQRLLDAYHAEDATYLHNDVKYFLFNPYDDSIKNFAIYVQAYNRQ